jgi:hypothetical protein
MAGPSFLRLIVLSLLISNLVQSKAEFIYDNSDTGGQDVYYSGLEFGDEIVLGGTSRMVSEFLFEYFGDFQPSGDETARIRIYRNDGPKTATGDSMPGTLLLDSGAFSVAPGWQTKKFAGLNVAVPGGMTWTVQFGGMTGALGDRAGLVLRPIPSVGTSYDDFWLKNNGAWQLFSWNGSPVANFAARIVSGAEPTSIVARRVSNKVVVEWAGLSILQVADTANGIYRDIPSARNRYECSLTDAAMKFWRLRD